MNDQTKAAVDAVWAEMFGLSTADFSRDAVHVVADRAMDDVVTVMVDRSCVVWVPDHLEEAARDRFSSLSATEAFTSGPLEQLVSERGEVVGLSWHHYGDQEMLRAESDAAVRAVPGDDAALIEFLEAGSIEDWAESGFPRHPASHTEEVQYWIMQEQDRVVAAGNMTPWRGVPADVGVLVGTRDRGRGFASRLVGAMLADCVQTAAIVRYRALSTNAASLAVAQRLGFARYGGNYLAKLTAV